MKIAPKGSSEKFLREHVHHNGDACLPWPFKLVPSGYGLAVIGGQQKPASRWMCILAHGEPPSGKHEAAHSCGNRSCVNPLHLRWATPKENSDDKLHHGTKIFGARSGKTTLNVEDVKAIRSAAPDLKYLSMRYGVSKGCISKIRSGQRWPHISTVAA